MYLGGSLGRAGKVGLNERRPVGPNEGMCLWRYRYVYFMVSDYFSRSDNLVDKIGEVGLK